MKVSMFSQVPYRRLPDDFEQRYESVVTTPWDLTEPEEVHASYRDALDQLMAAARSGFDGVAFTEHAQSSYDMAPNPSLLGSALAYATDAEGLDVAIYPMGRSLGKTREPVRVAEEYAMIDAISNGRLMAGFPVGLPYDASLNNGVPPMELRGRFEENLPLIRRAWSEPHPFPFNGTHVQYPSVNIWPRPIQQPHPPVWITGIGNPATMQYCLEHGYGFNYFGWFGATLTSRRIFDRFWEIADQMGQPRNPYRMGYMSVVCVGETDAEAEAEYGDHVRYFFNKGLGSIPLERLALPGSIGLPGLHAILTDPGDFGLYFQMRTATFPELAEAGCAIVGSPDTVAERLIEIATEFGIGQMLAMLQVGSMGRELTMKNVALFAERVLPRLKEVHREEDWDNHWWPERLGGVPPTPERTMEATA